MVDVSPDVSCSDLHFSGVGELLVEVVRVVVVEVDALHGVIIRLVDLHDAYHEHFS